MSNVRNILSEKLISLSQAARRFPGTNGAESVSPSTLWRWAMKGCRADDSRIVKLRVVRAGARWFTTEAAIAEFVESLSAFTNDDELEVPRSPAASRRACEAAEKELILAGA